MIVFTLASTVVLSSLTGKTLQTFFFFFLMFGLAEKIFDDIDPMGKLYQKYIHLSSAVKFCWFVCP